MPWMLQNHIKFTRFGAMAVTKPYKIIRCGATYATKPYKFISFGAMDITKPYKFTSFGATYVAKPYKMCTAMYVTKPYKIYMLWGHGCYQPLYNLYALGPWMSPNHVNLLGHACHQTL